MLWGLLFGWWDGFFMLAWRTLVWMCLGFLLANASTDVWIYGLSWDTASLWNGLGGAFSGAIVIGMLVGSLVDRWWSVAVPRVRLARSSGDVT